MFSELTQLEEALSFRLTAFLSWTASLVTQITSSFGTGCREKQELLNYATTFFFFLYRINRFVTFTRYSTQYGGHLLCVCYSSISNNLCVLIAPSFFFLILHSFQTALFLGVISRFDTKNFPTCQSNITNRSYRSSIEAIILSVIWYLIVIWLLR